MARLYQRIPEIVVSLAFAAVYAAFIAGSIILGVNPLLFGAGIWGGVLLLMFYLLVLLLLQRWREIQATRRKAALALNPKHPLYDELDAPFLE